MAKYFKIIGMAFGLLVLSIFIPSVTMARYIFYVVMYVIPVVLLVLLMRHTPSWVKWTVVGICIVMPFYVYFFEEIKFHWKYHIYISSVGYPTGWDLSAQKMWIENYLDCVFTNATFYSMALIVGFKLVRGTRNNVKIKKI